MALMCHTAFFIIGCISPFTDTNKHPHGGNLQVCNIGNFMRTSNNLDLVVVMVIYIQSSCVGKFHYHLVPYEQYESCCLGCIRIGFFEMAQEYATYTTVPLKKPFCCS